MEDLHVNSESKREKKRKGTKRQATQVKESSSTIVHRQGHGQSTLSPSALQFNPAQLISFETSTRRKRRRETAKPQASEHPFPTEYGDHFETPLQAYRDIEGALALVAKQLGKKRKHLRIWDPYYCAGRTSRLLAQLGFPRVEHRNEDFYAVIREGKQPTHDVIVTNPPYSGEHKRLCLQYCKASGKPWFLLIPNYVATKDYYKAALLGSAAGDSGEPFYLVPENRYIFDHPEGTGHADSPFFGVWFVHCGIHNNEVFAGITVQKKRGVDVVRSVEDLGQRGMVKTQRRLNPRQRKALRKRCIATSQGGGR